MKAQRPLQPDDWKTPKNFYDKLNKRFNFDFDPCPFQHDLTKWDGLKIEWGQRNFVNPPYSRKLKEDFIKKAYRESMNGKLCVMLLPASTDTKIFHTHIYGVAKIEFIQGRLKFEGYNNRGQLVKGPAMKGSMIVIYDGRKKTNKFC
tara:strand:- start:2591 stop:3031 length:441 start_codon:yes stop_codon:yes gene_type:complete